MANQQTENGFFFSPANSGVLTPYLKKMPMVQASTKISLLQTPQKKAMGKAWMLGMDEVRAKLDKEMQKTMAELRFKFSQEMGS